MTSPPRTNFLPSVCLLKISPRSIDRFRPTHNRQQQTTATDNRDILHSRSTMEKAKKRSSHPKASSGANRKKRQVRQGVSTSTPMEIDDADTNTPAKMPAAPPSPLLAHRVPDRTTKSYPAQLATMIIFNRITRKSRCVSTNGNSQSKLDAMRRRRSCITQRSLYLSCGVVFVSNYQTIVHSWS